MIGREKMSRRLRPSFEPLETKGLLSHMVTGLVQHHAGGGVAAEMGSPLLSLKVRLTTDHPSYRPGQIVKLTFTEMNHTGHDVFVELGPSIDGFSVTKRRQDDLDIKNRIPVRRHLPQEIIARRFGHIERRLVRECGDREVRCA